MKSKPPKIFTTVYIFCLIYNVIISLFAGALLGRLLRLMQ